MRENDELVLEIAKLMKRRNASGPAAAGALTAVLALMLMSNGYTKEKALEAFGSFWDAVAESKDKYDA